MNTSTDLFVQIRSKECISAAKALLLRVFPSEKVKKEELEKILRTLSDWEKDLFLEVMERNDNAG